MRSARMLLATAAASAALAIASPGAYAAGGDWDHDDSSYSKEHDKDGQHDKESTHKKDSTHDTPRGGMHTGGGALAAVSGDDWGSAHDPKQDPETYKHGKDGSDSYKDSKYDPETYKNKNDSGGWSGEHDKPRGGMHTGGGALAAPGVTAGGLAVLGVAGAGAFAMRRKKAAGSLA